MSMIVEDLNGDVDQRQEVDAGEYQNIQAASKDDYQPHRISRVLIYDDTDEFELQKEVLIFHSSFPLSILILLAFLYGISYQKLLAFAGFAVIM